MPHALSPALGFSVTAPPSAGRMMVDAEAVMKAASGR